MAGVYFGDRREQQNNDQQCDNACSCQAGKRIGPGFYDPLASITKICHSSSLKAGLMFIPEYRKRERIAVFFLRRRAVGFGGSAKRLPAQYRVRAWLCSETPVA